MIYNVVLQSSIGAGGAASEQFYYDWSQLEDAEYKVSFSFSCPVVNLTNTAIATIYVDLGQTQNKIAQVGRPRTRSASAAGDTNNATHTHEREKPEGRKHQNKSQRVRDRKREKERNIAQRGRPRCVDGARCAPAGRHRRRGRIQSAAPTSRPRGA